MSGYYISVAGQTYGPVTPEQIAEWVGAGSASAADYAWIEEKQAWVPLSEVPELAALFGAGATVPPVPPAASAVSSPDEASGQAPAASGSGPMCANHPDRESTAVCSVCAKDICDDCANNVSGKIHCAECVPARKKKAGGRRSSPVVVYGGILLILLGGGYLAWEYAGIKDLLGMGGAASTTREEESVRPIDLSPEIEEPAPDEEVEEAGPTASERDEIEAYAESVAGAMEAYAAENGEYPPEESLFDELASMEDYSDLSDEPPIEGWRLEVSFDEDGAYLVEVTDPGNTLTLSCDAGGTAWSDEEADNSAAEEGGDEAAGDEGSDNSAAEEGETERSDEGPAAGDEVDEGGNSVAPAADEAPAAADETAE